MAVSRERRLRSGEQHRGLPPLPLPPSSSPLPLRPLLCAAAAALCSAPLSLMSCAPQILRRETVRYDDQRGPAVLTVILLAVFTLSYVLAMVWSF